MSQRGNEGVKPLFLAHALPQQVGAVVALVKQLNEGGGTCRTEKAWVKL